MLTIIYQIAAYYLYSTWIEFIYGLFGFGFYAAEWEVFFFNMLIVQTSHRAVVHIWIVCYKNLILGENSEIQINNGGGALHYNNFQSIRDRQRKYSFIIINVVGKSKFTTYFYPCNIYVCQPQGNCSCLLYDNEKLICRKNKFSHINNVIDLVYISLRLSKINYL